MEEDLLALVRAHGGVVRRSVLGSRPGVKSALASLIATGRLRRVSRGVLALPAANPHLVTATVAGGSLTCVSAAAAMDLPLRAAPRSAHIALSANRGSSRSPLVRAAEIHRDRHVVAPSGPLVPAPLALAHASRCLPVPEVVALMDAALARGLVTTEELRRYRPRSGVVPFEHAVRLADGTAQSFPESLARVALRGAGLSVRSQVLLPGVGRVDFLVEDTVIVEIDGRAYHSDPAQFLADRRRDRASLRLGYATLRFAAVEVLASTEELTSQVVEVVRRRAA